MDTLEPVLDTGNDTGDRTPNSVDFVLAVFVLAVFVPAGFVLAVFVLAVFVLRISVLAVFCSS